MERENVTGYKIPRIHYPQVNEAVRQRLLRVAVAASSIECTSGLRAIVARLLAAARVFEIAVKAGYVSC